MRKINSIFKNDVFILINSLGIRRKKQLVVLLLFSIVNSFTEVLSISLLIPLISIFVTPESVLEIGLIKYFSEKFSIYNSQDFILPILIIFSICILLSGIIKISTSYGINLFTAALNNDLSCKLFWNNLNQQYSEYVKQNSSYVLTTINAYVPASVSLINALLKFFSSLVISTSIIFTLFFINFYVAFLTFMILFIFYLFISLFIKGKLRLNSKIIANNQSKSVKIIQEGLGGFRDLFLHDNQFFYFDLFKKSNFEFNIKLSQNQFLNELPRLTIEPFIMLAIAFLSFILSKNNSNYITFIPIIGTFLIAFQKLLPLIQQIYSAWLTYQSRLTSLKLLTEQINNFKNQKVNKKYIGTDLHKYFFNDSIVLKNISFSYGKKLILKDINLEIKKGNIIGIRGITGSGKSTLMDIIMGLIKPTTGTICIDNIDINNKKFKENLYAWRRSISHVPQSIFLKDGSIEQNIAFGEKEKKINKERLYQSSKKASLDKFIDKTEFGYNTNVGERGIKLSGGQRQRIGIARALYRDSKILILDESTSSLDYNTEEKILQSIYKLKGDLTVIIVAHRLNTLLNCDKVYEISEGCLFEKK